MKLINYYSTNTKELFPALLIAVKMVTPKFYNYYKIHRCFDDRIIVLKFLEQDLKEDVFKETISICEKYNSLKSFI